MSNSKLNVERFVYLILALSSALVAVAPAVYSVHVFSKGEAALQNIFSPCVEFLFSILSILFFIFSAKPWVGGSVLSLAVGIGALVFCGIISLISAHSFDTGAVLIYGIVMILGGSINLFRSLKMHVSK